MLPHKRVAIAQQHRVTLGRHLVGVEGVRLRVRVRVRVRGWNPKQAATSAPDETPYQKFMSAPALTLMTSPRLATRCPSRAARMSECMPMYAPRSPRQAS